eukprot:Nk52_evm10s1360 gene=Nk52_evmTU10s1360
MSSTSGFDPLRNGAIFRISDTSMLKSPVPRHVLEQKKKAQGPSNPTVPSANVSLMGNSPCATLNTATQPTTSSSILTDRPIANTQKPQRSQGFAVPASYNKFRVPVVPKPSGEMSDGSETLPQPLLKPKPSHPLPFQVHGGNSTNALHSTMGSFESLYRASPLPKVVMNMMSKKPAPVSTEAAAVKVNAARPIKSYSNSQQSPVNIEEAEHPKENMKTKSLVEAPTAEECIVEEPVEGCMPNTVNDSVPIVDESISLEPDVEGGCAVKVGNSPNREEEPCDEKGFGMEDCDGARTGESKEAKNTEQQTHAKPSASNFDSKKLSSRNVSKKSKKVGSDEESSSSGDPDCDLESVCSHVLRKWFIRLAWHKNKKCSIVVEGIRHAANDYWHSSAIVNRMNARMVVTKSGAVYGLWGPMDVNQTEEETGIPDNIRKAFMSGFPYNWEKIVMPFLDEINKEPEVFQEKVTNDSSQPKPSLEPDVNKKEKTNNEEVDGQEKTQEKDLHEEVSYETCVGFEEGGFGIEENDFGVEKEKDKEDMVEEQDYCIDNSSKVKSGDTNDLPNTENGHWSEKKPEHDMEDRQAGEAKVAQCGASQRKNPSNVRKIDKKSALPKKVKALVEEGKAAKKRRHSDNFESASSSKQSAKERRHVRSKTDGSSIQSNQALSLDNMKSTRSGRKVKPTLKYWTGEKLKIDLDKNCISIVQGNNPDFITSTVSHGRKIKTEVKKESESDKSRRSYALKGNKKMKNESKWTKEDLEKLSSIVLEGNPQEASFWKKVAKKMCGFSANECQEAYYAHKFSDPKTSVDIKPKSTAKGVTAGVGTALRKKQVRQVLDQNNAGHEDDAFESPKVSEVKSVKVNISSKESQLKDLKFKPRGEGLDESVREDEDTHSSSPEVSSNLLRKPDRDAVDGYVAKIQARKRQGKGIETSKPKASKLSSREKGESRSLALALAGKGKHIFKTNSCQRDDYKSDENDEYNSEEGFSDEYE